MASRTITTDAIGRCEAVPNLATVNAVVVGEGETASAARATANDRAATLRESITDVAIDQIRTVDIQVQDTDEVFDPVTDAPFQATERLQVDCVPENAESVVIDVADAGGRVETVEFQLHEDSHQDLQNRAINSAMKRARQKAEHMAAAEGLTVAEIQEATTKEVSTGFESIVDEALASGPDAELHPAPMAVSERVEVKYTLQEE